jgi:hypothetical protein
VQFLTEIQKHDAKPPTYSMVQVLMVSAIGIRDKEKFYSKLCFQVRFNGILGPMLRRASFLQLFDMFELVRNM